MSRCRRSAPSAKARALLTGLSDAEKNATIDRFMKIETLGARRRPPPGGRVTAIETFDCDLTSSHWGAYEVGRRDGKVVELRGWAEDPEPSPIGLAMLDAYRSPLRVQRPAVRAGCLKKGAAAGGAGPRATNRSSRYRGNGRLALVAG